MHGPRQHLLLKFGRKEAHGQPPLYKTLTYFTLSQNLEAMKNAHSKLLDEMEDLNTDLKRVSLVILNPGEPTMVGHIMRY